MALRRTIGTWSLLFVAFGGMVGSGWLFGPLYVAQLAGPSAILSWVIGGALMMLVALTFAELASTFPLTGGTIRYIQMSHGAFASFSMAWIGWLSAAAVAPIETMALIQYASNHFPFLMRPVNHTYVLSAAGVGISALVLLFMCAINAVGVRFLARANNVVVFFKLLIPLLVIIVLFLVDFHVHNISQHGFAPGGFKAIVQALPIAGVIFSFIGYTPAVQLAGEAKNPQKSIPIAIICAILLAIFLYVGLQLIFITALQPSDYAQGWHALSFKGDAGPFVGIALSLGLAWLAAIIFAGAMISPFGTGLVYTASAARLCYAMGENGFVPASLLKLNRHGIPARIIVLNFCIGLLLLLPFPSWQKMVGFLVSALIFVYGVGPLVLPVLRKHHPEVHRPFRVPLANMMCFLAFYICNLIIFWTGWDVVLKMLIAMAIGYVVLLIMITMHRVKNQSWDLRHGWWMLLYLALMGFISYLSDFGHGIGVIPFGWDFLVVAVLSFVIFCLAKQLSLKHARP